MLKNDPLQLSNTQDRPMMGSSPSILFLKYSVYEVQENHLVYSPTLLLLAIFSTVGKGSLIVESINGSIGKSENNLDNRI